MPVGLGAEGTKKKQHYKYICLVFNGEYFFLNSLDIRYKTRIFLNDL